MCYDQKPEPVREAIPIAAELARQGRAGERLAREAAKRLTMQHDRIEELRQENEQLRKLAQHFEKFVGFAATCRRENTYEWMQLMLDWLNGAAMRFDEAAYFDLCGADHFVLRHCEKKASN